LNSTEISDSNRFNQAVKFVRTNFKKITGRDIITAREVGTKITVEFEAGKVLIQTNIMPTFSKIDAGIKDRIIVIQFPYTCTDNSELLTDFKKYKPIDRTLKYKFKQGKYLIAITHLIMDT
jgi:phage/plasmid-associated DNA primase